MLLEGWSLLKMAQDGSRWKVLWYLLGADLMDDTGVRGDHHFLEIFTDKMSHHKESEEWL